MGCPFCGGQPRTADDRCSLCPAKCAHMEVMLLCQFRLDVAVMTVTALRQATADHVADAEQHDVEPCPVRQEVVGAPVGRFDQVRREQDADDRGDEHRKFGCLERCLRLVSASLEPVSDGLVAVHGGGICDCHFYS
jgi:hypothetical protein